MVDHVQTGPVQVTGPLSQENSNGDPLNMVSGAGVSVRVRRKGRLGERSRYTKRRENGAGRKKKSTMEKAWGKTS